MLQQRINKVIVYFIIMPFTGIVTREHSICAGHRVVGQHDNLGKPGPCQSLHGHEYKFELFCHADELDEIGMIIDFSEIKRRMCSWLDAEWDHRMLIWDQDPWQKQLTQIDPRVVIVPFNPTAENIAQYLVDTIGPEVFKGSGVVLSGVTVHETAKCSATYSK